MYLNIPQLDWPSKIIAAVGSAANFSVAAVAYAESQPLWVVAIATALSILTPAGVWFVRGWVDHIEKRHMHAVERENERLRDKLRETERQASDARRDYSRASEDLNRAKRLLNDMGIQT